LELVVFHLSSKDMDMAGCGFEQHRWIAGKNLPLL
jgi:hypothetical protein